MAHPKNTRDKVRHAFVYGRLSLEVAAMSAGVSFDSARRWKTKAAEAGDDWDKEQAAQLLSDGGVEGVARQMLSGLVRQYQSTMTAIETDEKIPAADKVKLLASLADAYNKTIASSKRILPKTQELAIAKGVVTQFAAFVKQRYPQHMQALAEVLVSFGRDLAKFYAQQDNE
ncbi:DUF1804 family protein [Pandoraea sp. SD6-2]|uniref:DUF1804 family protein n=1 Tax=Pandoraea sp. SD6-2 TaxID=1286093 RepID=UPI00032EF11F|nr:DUF1804 family protein [Pandoraea sp. SD6-2]EON13074.1 DNA-binding protein [Pandoraea sp. SD6-2]